MNRNMSTTENSNCHIFLFYLSNMAKYCFYFFRPKLITTNCPFLLFKRNIITIINCFDKIRVPNSTELIPTGWLYCDSFVVFTLKKTDENEQKYHENI